MISYSHESDAVYIQLSGHEVAHTRTIGDARVIDYDCNWHVVGVEILNASGGIDLRDLPERGELEAEAKVLNFPIFI